MRRVLLHDRPAAWLVAAAVAALLAADLPAGAAARAALALHAAGLVAWLGMRGRAPSGGAHPVRALAGLVLGAALAHLGWALLHAPEVAAHPLALLDAGAGYSLLFVPLGPLLVAPRGAAGTRFRADALASLPLAFATARLGCLEVGCCHGVWSAALAAPVPTATFEAIACAALALGHERPRAAAHPARGAVALLGLGAVRLAVEPWRAPPPLGEPWLPPAALAGLQAAAGLALLARMCAGRRAHGVPGAAEARP